MIQGFDGLTQDSGVYVLRNIVNGKVYIGSAGNIRSRVRTHIWNLQQGRNRPNRHLQNAWNKYGGESFEALILFICPNDQCTAVEQSMLDHLACHYNVSRNAAKPRLGMKNTPEHNRKLSEANIGNTNFAGHKHSEQTIALMRAIALSDGRGVGNKNRLGAFLSPETRLKISRSLAGRSRPDISAGLLGHKASATTRKKMSESQKAAWARRKQ